MRLKRDGTYRVIHHSGYDGSYGNDLSPSLSLSLSSSFGCNETRGVVPGQIPWRLATPAAYDAPVHWICLDH